MLPSRCLHVLELVAGAMGFFMPYVYETAGGLSNQEANLLQAVLWVLTALATYFGFAKYGDKANHRIFFFVGAAMAAASWIVLTYAGMAQSWSLWAFVALWGISAESVPKHGMHYGQPNSSDPIPRWLTRRDVLPGSCQCRCLVHYFPGNSQQSRLHRCRNFHDRTAISITCHWHDLDA